MNNIGDTGQNTIHEAIQAVNTRKPIIPLGFTGDAGAALSRKLEKPECQRRSNG